MKTIFTNINRFSYDQINGRISDRYMANTIQYLISCARAIKDEYTKKLSYLDIFDIVLIPKDSPVTISSFVVGGKAYTTEGGKITFIARILDPLGNILQTSPLDEATVVTGDIEMSFFFNLVKFSMIGRHYIKISANGIDLDDGNKFFIEVKKL